MNSRPEHTCVHAELARGSNAAPAESGGFTDRNASHESETVLHHGTTKWVAQQFIWSHPISADALAGTVEPEQPLDKVVF